MREFGGTWFPCAAAGDALKAAGVLLLIRVLLGSLGLETKALKPQGPAGDFRGLGLQSYSFMVLLGM